MVILDNEKGFIALHQSESTKALLGYCSLNFIAVVLFPTPFGPTITISFFISFLFHSEFWLIIFPDWISNHGSQFSFPQQTADGLSFQAVPAFHRYRNDNEDTVHNPHRSFH